MKLETAKIGLYGILALAATSTPQSSHADIYGKETTQIRCNYKEGRRPDWNTTVELKLLANFNPGKATLREIRGTLNRRDENSELIEIANIQQKSAERVRYNGVKYPGYFRFRLDSFRGLGRSYTGDAHLIISPEIETTSQGKTYHDAVLDVSYDDHHGDYVPVVCWTYKSRDW